MMRNGKILLVALLLLAAPEAGGAGWWRLYFTSPGRPDFLSHTANPESGLVSAINRSRKYVYGAFYEVSAPRVADSLIRARRRGVDVRIVTDGHTARKRKRVISRYEEAGMPVVTRSSRRRGIMHDKFAVIDGEFLWTGSYNPTVNDAMKNNNNAIIIRSAILAGIYLKEFNEMFEDRVFGNRTEPGPFADLRRRYHVKIEETDINAYFSPEDSVERIIIRRLKKAKSSIYFMAFSFTSPGIGEMMISKHRQGVTVSGIFERRGSREAHSQYTRMKIEGCAVRLDRNRNAMHHKVIVIDGSRVIMGSYNFSRNANRNNDENILIIDSAEIAKAFLSEFRRLW